ncbi:MAG TPA: UvrD-helicase domain-containing protein [Planctomycetia bacterium]|nr:UvrD-helicase domain-containing protein [Planctomycetia bacterium]
MIEPPLHRAIRASAGSGKTYSLTNRLLSLIIAGAAPETILATTFTRKAAGEIMGRLLLRLAAASRNATAATRLGKELGLARLTPAEAMAPLVRLAEDLHRLRICTLDSLFSTLAGSFGFELQLPPAWRVAEEDEDGALRDAAIQAVLSGDRGRELPALLRLLSKGETTRAVSRQIREAVDGMYVLYRQTDEEAWKRLEPPPRLAAEALNEALERMREAPLPKNANWKKQVDKDLEAAGTGDWLRLLESGLAGKILAGEETYYSKPIESPVIDAYLPLLAHAKAVVLEEVASQTKATHDLLAKFHDEYVRLKSEERLLRFEDVSFALQAAALWRSLGGDAPDLFFRMDQATEHLLLDEFQDTSNVQWDVLQPLAANIVANAEDHSFFCVGDGKQAIYGWRGGSAEIFERIDAQLPGLAWSDLVKSFRSAPPVIDAVNRVFGTIGENLALARDEQCAQAAKEWQATFKPHATAKEKAPGYFLMRTAAAAAEGEEPREVVMRAAAQLVKELSERMKGGTIAILTRKNAGVAQIIADLQDLGVTASQEGGGRLTDATGVEAVLAALQTAEHPGDTAAAYFVANTPLGPALKMPSPPAPGTAEASAAIRRELADQGFGATIGGWANVLGPAVGSHDRVRLSQLVDQAYWFDREADPRPGAFVARVRQLQVEDPTPSRVRAMTLHQAKGLEFDAVVLPELDEPIVGQTPPYVHWEDPQTGMTIGVLRYANEAVRNLLPPDIQAAFQLRTRRVTRESLCLLYVALTRAIHATYVVTAPSVENERSLPRTFTGVLRSAFGAASPVAPETTVAEIGDPNWPTAPSPLE